jgi:hypothetical protein
MRTSEPGAKPLPQIKTRKSELLEIDETSVSNFIERLVKTLRNIGKK